MYIASRKTGNNDGRENMYETYSVPDYYTTSLHCVIDLSETEVDNWATESGPTFCRPTVVHYIH